MPPADNDASTADLNKPPADVPVAEEDSATATSRIAESHAGDPIRARRESYLGRIGRWARQRRGLVATGALVVVVAVGLAASWVALSRERQKVEHLNYAALIRAAHMEVENHNFSRAYDLLGRCPEEMRGWEFDFVRNTLSWHGDRRLGGAHGIESLAFYDETNELIGLDDEGILIWSPDGDEKRIPIVKTDYSTSSLGFPRIDKYAAFFSPDAKHVWIRGADDIYHAHDPQTGERVAELGFADVAPEDWTDADRLIVFDGKFKQFAVLSTDASRIFTRQDRTAFEVRHIRASEQAEEEFPPREFAGHFGPTTSAAFSPDGTLLVSGGADSTVRVWDAATGNELHALNGHYGDVVGVTFSADGTMVASGSSDGVRVWTPATGSLKAHFAGLYFGDNDEIRFSGNGRFLASCCERMKLVRVYDISRKSIVADLPMQQVFPDLLAINFDGTQIAVGGLDSIDLWEIPRPLSRSDVLHQGASPVVSVAFHPDGSRIAIASYDGEVRILDARTGAERQRLSVDIIPRVIAFSPRGDRLAIGGDGQWIVVWKPEQNQRELIDQGDPDFRVFSLEFVKQGNGILIGALGEARVWSVAEKRLLEESAVPVAAVDDGALMVGSTWRHERRSASSIGVWTNGNKQLRTFHCKDMPFAIFVAYRPEGRRLAIVGFDSDGDRNIEVRTISTQGNTTLQHRFHTAMTVLSAVKWHPTEDRLVLADFDGSVTIWNSVTGIELLKLRGHGGAVLGLDISPDGRRIVSGGIDGTVRIWDASSL